MIGLVLMAAKLATLRAAASHPKMPSSCYFKKYDREYIHPVCREDAWKSPDFFPASAEFYRILDRIAEGETVL